MPRVAEILKKTALFAGLDESEIELLAARTGVKSFAEGTTLFFEGEACDGLYIVVSGRIRIYKTSRNGREQVLAIEGPGGSVAELPVFDGDPYPASASALSDSSVLFVSRSDLRALCLERPAVSLKLLQVMGGRLRRLVGIIEELSFSTVRHRLISWILRRVEEGGTPFAIDTSHQELAAQIGTVRELVSRNLARLQSEELIAISGKEITVLNRAGLENDLSSSV